MTYASVIETIIQSATNSATTINSNALIATLGLSVLLITACGGNPQLTPPAAHSTHEATNNDAPTESELIRRGIQLTRQETEATLERLRAIRKKQRDNTHTKTYAGPIDSVWQRILARPLIPYDDNLRIERQVTILLRDQQYLQRVSRRAKPYIYYILEEIDKRGLPRELALLPIIESAYRPTAVSKSRATGLWQFIPSTSKFLGMKTDWWYDARRDIISSTTHALDYLHKINKKFDGDWLLTLAAYNAGHGKVSRAIARNRKHGKPTDYWNLKLPRETMNYVPRFLAVHLIFTHPQDYQIQLHPVKNQRHFAVVNTESQLDLTLAAEMADMTLADLSIYNPGFLRRTTAPDGPHRLLLPLSKQRTFEKKFAALDKDKRILWTEHKVRKGETLTGIALQYGVGISMLKSANGIKGSLIRIGQILQVPASMSRRANFIYYTVKSGDTLWDIARQHKVTTQSLLALNNLQEDSVLYPGQRLKIRKATRVALKF